LLRRRKTEKEEKENNWRKKIAYWPRSKKEKEDTRDGSDNNLF